MRAGVFQPEAGGFDTSMRLERLAAALRATSVDLVVCPELFLSGYDVGDSVADMAETRDGPFAGQIANIARSTDTAIIYGYPERQGESIFNSAHCIGPSGRSLAHHRKLFFPPGRERQLFDAGDRLTVFTLNGVRLGILICYDAELPELARATAELGADAIIVRRPFPTRGPRWRISSCRRGHSKTACGCSMPTMPVRKTRQVISGPAVSSARTARMQQERERPNS